MINKFIYDGKSAQDLKSVCNETSFELPGADDYNNYRDFIFEHISFVKILNNLKIFPDDCTSGKYTHKMVCPFKFHKNGREKTSSFRFNEDNKTFFCFGCSEGGNILKFLQYYVGGWEQFHLEKLAEMSGLIKDGAIEIPLEYLEIEKAPPKETNFKIIFDTGIVIRQYLLDIRHSNLYFKECEWADDILIKIDKYFDGLDEENITDAEKVYKNINHIINKRKKKILHENLL